MRHRTALQHRYGHARGQAQLAIVNYMTGRSGPVELTAMARHPDFRGVHFKSIMSAAEALKAQGVIDYDGRFLSWRRLR